MSRTSCVYSRMSESLRYFHEEHRRSMAALVSDAESAGEPEALWALGSALSGFARGLDMHHRIEDAQMFPLLAGKVDLGSLEAAHHDLESVLAQLAKHAAKLRKMESMAQYDRAETLSLLRALETLVNAHEKEEEAIFSTDNLKKHCTKEELRKFA